MTERAFAGRGAGPFRAAACSALNSARPSPISPMAPARMAARRDTIPAAAMESRVCRAPLSLIVLFSVG